MFKGLSSVLPANSVRSIALLLFTALLSTACFINYAAEFSEHAGDVAHGEIVVDGVGENGVQNFAVAMVHLILDP